MAVGRSHTFTLDEATLTNGLSILSAGGGLPRRIGLVPKYADAILASSPGVMYRMDETSGAVLTDASGNDRHGSILNATYGVAGVDAGGLCLTNKANLHLSNAPAGAFFNLTITQPFTIECWVKSPYTGGLDGLRYLFYNGSMQVQFQSGSIYFDIVEVQFSKHYRATMTASAAGISINNWSHMVFTYDGRGGTAGANGMNIYTQGVLRSPSRTTYGSQIPTPYYGTPYIGYAPTAASHNIDNFAFYTRVLTAQEILDHYNGVPGPLKASFTASIASTKTPTGLLVPGATRTETALATARKTRAFLSRDAGVTRQEAEIGTYLPAGLPIGGTGETVQLDLELDRTVWIGDNVGGGPSIVYEEADPAVNVTAVASDGTDIQVTLNAPINSVAAPTSDPGKIQIESATANAQTLTLDLAPIVTNIESLTTTEGQVGIALDTPIGTLPTPINGPKPALQVSNLSKDGSNLTIEHGPTTGPPASFNNGFDIGD